MQSKNQRFRKWLPTQSLIIEDKIQYLFRSILRLTLPYKRIDECESISNY